MPVFTWEGRTRQGTTKKGVIEGVNEAAVMAQLRGQMIVPVKVKLKPKDILEGIDLFKGGVKIRELVIFTRQFATMIDAGLPLVQCLEIQAGQQSNKAFKEILSADALRKHPKAFDHLYVNLVAAGEVGGILDTILTRLAVYLEKADALRRKVKGAMVYPSTILVVAIAVIVLLLVKVIPVFQKMFDDFGGALPGPTQMVVTISEWLQDYILILLGLIAFVVIVFFQARKRLPKFAYRTDAIALKIPIFGSLLKKVAVSRFSRTLGTMISSGVPILDALEICAKTAGNRVIEAGGAHDRGATRGRGGLPGHGGPDDRGRRVHRCNGFDAGEDRRLLR
jgi:type IV pilus assembly protein PilC